MRRLFHKSIILLFEVIDDPDHDSLYLVLEYMDGGVAMEWDSSAMRFLSSSPDHQDGAIPERRAAVCFAGLAEALLYLHARGIAHRDVKPQNVLVNSKGRCRLSDFGVAAQFTGPDVVTTETQGTHAFWPPECCVGGGVSFSPFKADEWALAVTLYCFVFGRVPFWADGAGPLLDAIITQPLNFPAGAGSPGVRDLLSRMLNKDVAQRLPLRDAVSHPWVAAHMAADREERRARRRAARE